MQKTFDKDTIIRWVITAVVVVALYLLIRRLSGVLLPFVVSFLVAYILEPIVSFFQYKCRLKYRILCVLLTLGLTLGVVVGAFAVLSPMVAEQVETFSQSLHEYRANLGQTSYISPEIDAYIKEWVSNLDLKTMMNDPEFRDTVKNIIPKVGNIISSGLSSLAGLAVVFICLLYVIFILLDYEKISNNWQNYVPLRYRKTVKTLMLDLGKNMSGYFRGQSLIALCVGILFAIGFQIIDLPMGIMMGLIVGVFNLVPYMQALGIPPCILLGLLQSMESDRPFWVILLSIAAVFVVVQSIQDLILTPKIMGNVTGLGPSMILLSLSIWGALLGIMGMIIALPLTTLLISYYQRFVLHEGGETVPEKE